MSKIPFFNLSEGTRTIRAEVDEAIARVIDSTSFVLGPEVEKFEEEFAAYCDARFTAGVSSGTAALHLILQGYGGSIVSESLESACSTSREAACSDMPW